MNDKLRLPALPVRLFAAAAATAIALAACGGDSTPAGGAATADRTPTPGATSGDRTGAGNTAAGNTSTGGGSSTTNPTPQAASSPAPGNSTVVARGELDACTLITSAEAAAAIASAVKLDHHEKNGTRSECTYVSSGNDGTEVVYLYIGSGRVERDAFDLARRTYSNARPLSGLGEDAFAVELDAPVAQVHVYKNGHYFTVAITNMHDPQRLEKARTLGQTVASRL